MCNEEQLLKLLNEKEFKIIGDYISVEKGLSIYHFDLVFIDKEE